jgi:hypothetical protein
MKRFLEVLGGCLFVALLLAAVGVGLLHLIPGLGEFPGGMPPSYQAVDYDPRLTREASTATVVIAALNRYHSKHSVFPAVASQLAPYLCRVSYNNCSQTRLRLRMVLLEDRQRHGLSALAYAWLGSPLTL